MFRLNDKATDLHSCFVCTHLSDSLHISIYTTTPSIPTDEYRWQLRGKENTLMPSMLSLFFPTPEELTSFVPLPGHLPRTLPPSPHRQFHAVYAASHDRPRS